MAREKTYFNEVKMSSTKKPSRFRYLSRFLPRLNTESKCQAHQLLSNSQHLSEPSNRSQSPERPSPPSLKGSRSPERPPPPPPLPPPPSRPAPTSPFPSPSPDISPCSTQDRRSRRYTSPSPSSVSSPTYSEPVTSKNSPLIPSSAGRLGFIEKRPMTSFLSPQRSTLLDPERENAYAKIRKSWLPGSRARSARPNTSECVEEPMAWINVGSAKIEYNLGPLIKGDRVSLSP